MGAERQCRSVIKKIKPPYRWLDLGCVQETED